MDSPADLVATADDIAAMVTDDQASGVDITESNSLSIPWIVLPAFAALMLGTVTVYLGKKKTLPRSLGLPKLRSFKIGGVLLCLIITSTVLIEVSASTVNALPLYGRATIWGSESSDAWNSTYNLSWRKHPDEVTRQQATSAFLQSEFAQNGYSATDSQGTKGYTSYKSNIISRIGTDQANYARVAVVDFDHGNGLIGIPGLPSNEFHFMFEDQRGTMSGPICHPPNPPDHPEYAVYDYEIYPETYLESNFFVLINTCNSAYIADTIGQNQYDCSQGMVNGRARGMPYAWSHGIKVLPYGNSTPPSGWMSGDGYAYPDDGQFCYIGFYMGSAALTQDVDGKYGTLRPYWWWLEHFFAYALTSNWSVKQALNEASLQVYEGNFGEIPLHTSYTAIWPMFYKNATESQPSWHSGSEEQGPGSKMVVYGNSNIKLYQPLLTLSASGGLSPQFTIDGQSYSTGNHRVISDDYTINVNDIPNYAFSHFSYKGSNYGRPATIQIDQDGELTAVYNWNPTYYTLSISSTGGGHTDPSGDQQYLSYTYAHVVAAPDNSSWVFDSWRLDGNNAGCNPSKYVYMSGPHTLQAIFVPPPSYYFVSSIRDYGWGGFQAGVSDPDNLIGISNDGQYATLYAGGYYDEAWIIGNMNTQATGHIKLYGSGYSSHLRVYVSSDGSNYNLVSDQYVSQGSPGWIDCGFYSGNFNYIAVDVYADPPPAAIYVDSVRVDPPVYHTLTISSGSGGSTTPSPGAYQYAEGTPVAVTANPNSGYVLDYWLLDGQNAGSQNPKTVTMNSNHSLQANFRQVSQHSLTVLAYNQYGQPGYVPLYIDSQYVGTTGYAYSVTDGNHQIYVESPFFDGNYHYFQYYYYDGNYNYNNPTTLSVTSDKTVTAYYYSYY